MLRPLHSLVATLTLGLAFAAATARGADYATIILKTAVDRAADKVWKKIGDFCALGSFIKMNCVYTSGSGGLGTVRRLGDRITEVMVAQTSHSYTYTQPDTKILYHGTVDVEPAGTGHSEIIYSLFYDQSQLTTPQARSDDRARRTKLFTGLLATMKKAAEGD
jgi:hypothetical protein